MRFIDLRKRLCQDRHSPSPSPDITTKQRLPDGCVLLARKSESSLQLNLESFQTKLNLSPGGSSLPPLEPHLTISSLTRDKVTRAKVLLENFYSNLLVQQRQRTERRRRLE